VCVNPLLSTFEHLNQSLWNVVYHANGVHLNGVLHKSLPSVCVSLCVTLLSLQGNGSVKCLTPFGARQRLGKHVPAATNTRNNRGTIGGVIFCAVRALSKGSLWVCLCIPLSLLGNNSVMFPRQRRIDGGVVFYAVCVVSNESTRLVLSRTSCIPTPRYYLGPAGGCWRRARGSNTGSSHR
jgi:hypothetical protein